MAKDFLQARKNPHPNPPPEYMGRGKRPGTRFSEKIVEGTSSDSRRFFAEDASEGRGLLPPRDGGDRRRPAQPGFGAGAR